MIKNCKTCNVEFEANHHRTVYCSNCKPVIISKTEQKVDSAVDEAIQESVIAEPIVENKSDNKPSASFLEIQELAPSFRNMLEVYNKNPNYAFMWQRKQSMAGANRCGIWHTVDKRHPDFKDMYVEQDDSPKESYYSTGDLVLACCRVETYNKAKRRDREFVRMRTEGFERRHKESLDRISKEGINVSDKTFDGMRSLVNDYESK